MKTYVLGITGASGTIVGVRVLKELARTSCVHLVLSSGAFYILKTESGLDWSGTSPAEVQDKVRTYFSSDNIFYWDENNMASPPASGSFKTNGMFVVPCSMKSLSGIANGYGNTLIERAADVTLKEGRRLVLSPRETPFGAIHLENMLKLSRLGVGIVPPVMGFYHSPDNLDSMIDFTVGKILDFMDFEHDLYKRWGSPESYE